MAVAKKGVFFTLSAIILLTVFFAGLLFEISPQISEKNKVISVKTANMNQFVRGLDQDVERGLFIAGFRALLAAEQFVSDNNQFLNNVEDNLKEAMRNGSIDGNSLPMMDQSTIPEWLSRIQTEAIRLGILVNFSEEIIIVNQSSPWVVNYYVNVSYNVTDIGRTATFNRDILIDTEVSIIKLKDPIYTIFTSGRIVRSINSTPYEGNYASGLNITNLQNHINDLLYANSTGPSYLMRLEGNLNNSPMGIESIVFIPDLEDQGLPVFERTSVDYLYFANSGLPFFTINNTFESWFRLDDGHLDKYQVRDITE